MLRASIILGTPSHIVADITDITPREVAYVLPLAIFALGRN